MNQPLNFTLEEIQTLLAMQDELNTYIHPEWKKQNFDWNFAIIDEVREIREHLGWKWWKEGYKCGLTEANRKQVQLEVIDILHFVLSMACESHINPDKLREWMSYSYSSIDDLVGKCNNLLVTVVNETADYPEAWNDLAVATGLTKEEVLETYLQKYVLNKFRQDHGYKDGSYCKTWKFEFTVDAMVVPVYLEDNEVLAKEVEHLTMEGQEVSNQGILYSRLEERYNSRLNK